MFALLLLGTWFREAATTTQSVVRIITAAGSTAARASITYEATGARVVSFRAWLLAPAESTDRVVNQGELRSSLRQRTISVPAPPEPSSPGLSSSFSPMACPLRAAASPYRAPLFGPSARIFLIFSLSLGAKPGPPVIFQRIPPPRPA